MIRVSLGKVLEYNLSEQFLIQCNVLYYIEMMTKIVEPFLCLTLKLLNLEVGLVCAIVIVRQ